MKRFSRQIRRRLLSSRGSRHALKWRRVNEIRVSPQRWRLVVVMGLLSGIFTFLVLLVVVERNTTSAYPQTVTGKFMGFDASGSAMAFQPDGSSTGTSYAWSGHAVGIG